MSHSVAPGLRSEYAATRMDWTLTVSRARRTRTMKPRQEMVISLYIFPIASRVVFT
ncbi:MAG TPA: hypothetical protein VNW04_15330 [Puia sp.]|nr:hypothetical protein [Puia sp.]